jgi:peptide/nickel transport system permease protein
MAVLGPLIKPDTATQFVGVPFAEPSGGHLLGTDTLGRDVLSRLLDGGWVLLLMAVSATIIGVASGALAGIAAAYIGGISDGVIMRSVDVLLAFPQIVFALMLVSLYGPKLWLIVFAVGLSHGPQVARVIRAATLDISERDFVRAAELNGLNRWRVMLFEITPNLVTPLTVEVGLRLTYSIVIISGLAFLGFGQSPPAANWGLMINENRIGLELNPWATLAPAAVIALLTIGMNTLTDAIARAAARVGGTTVTTAIVDPAVAQVI